MKYIKLIALKMDDFCSSIFFEDNYSNDDIEVAKADMERLENEGCNCFLFEMTSNIKTNTYNN